MCRKLPLLLLLVRKCQSLLLELCIVLLESLFHVMIDNTL